MPAADSHLLARGTGRSMPHNSPTEDESLRFGNFTLQENGPERAWNDLCTTIKYVA